MSAGVIRVGPVGPPSGVLLRGTSGEGIALVEELGAAAATEIREYQLQAVARVRAAGVDINRARHLRALESGIRNRTLARVRAQLQAQPFGAEILQRFDDAFNDLLDEKAGIINEIENNQRTSEEDPPALPTPEDGSGPSPPQTASADLIAALQSPDDDALDEVDPAASDMVAPDPAEDPEVAVHSAVPTPAQDRRDRYVSDPPLVRRPTLGLMRDEERYSSIEIVVMGGDGDREIELLNSSYPSGRSPITTNFFIQSINEARASSVQVEQSFGSFYLTAAGDQPRVIQCSGLLLESQNFKWYTEWQKNYDRYLRARQCILHRAQVFLTVGDTIYVGYIVGAGTGRTADPVWEVASWNFQMVLRDTIDLAQSRASDPTAFVGGIRIPDTVRAFAEASEEDRMSRAAQALEIVQGQLDGQVQLRDLELPGDSPAAVVSEFRLDTLLASARRLNARMGSGFIDEQSLRTMYLRQRRYELELLGLYDPYGPEDYGIRPLQEVDARNRARQRTNDFLDMATEAADRVLPGGRRSGAGAASAASSPVLRVS